MTPRPEPIALRHAVPLLLVGLAAGCAPPTETLHIVARDTPVLPEPEDDEQPLAVLRPGQLVELLPLRPNLPKQLRWKGIIDGKPAIHEGPLVYVRGSSSDAPSFGFQQDFGATVEVPTAKWLCDRMHAPPECVQRLHRAQLGSGLVAWDQCYIGDCRIAVVHGREVSAITVTGLAEVRPAVLEGQDVMVITVRWVKNPNWTGADALVLRVGRKLERALLISTLEIDGRNPPSVERLGNLSVDPDGIRFEGTRREVAPSTGAVLRADPIREVYHLAQKAVAAPAPASAGIARDAGR